MLASDSRVSEPVVSDSIPQPVPGATSWPSAQRAREPRPREAVRERGYEPAAEAQPATEAQPAAEDAEQPVAAAAAQAAAQPAAQIDRQAALRALRNLEATEARLERNARREADEARGKLVQELLPVLDNLDRTIRAAHPGRDPAILEGVRLVRHQLEGVLRGYGVERIDAIGQRFDPGVHEAIGVTAVADPSRHGLVVQQVEPGYRFAGRLLRPAKVSVGKLAAPVEPAHRSFWR
jgi:molecular chaperone GrpE (heat shock protein)